ncbi:MAG: hypothetical protein ACPGOY_01640 [Rhodospirillaceae bacterium]
MEPRAIHAMAPEHIPTFVVAADGSDYLFNVMVVFTIIFVLLIGVGYFTLHALPERMAHKNEHSQFQLVAILAVLALFTHNNIFWFAAILLAGLKLPDLMTPIKSIAKSLLMVSRSVTAMSAEAQAVAGAGGGSGTVGGGASGAGPKPSPRTQATAKATKSAMPDEDDGFRTVPPPLSTDPDPSGPTPTPPAPPVPPKS